MTRCFTCAPVNRISGRITVPGDKSISHRALMLGALAEGQTTITGFLAGEDCLATLAALRAMGVDIQRRDATTLGVTGRGLYGLRPPPGVLDLGNSGTAMRLLTGLLAPQPFDAVLTGDASLRRRPMERVAAPLRRMGADVTTEGGCPPIRIGGGRTLEGIRYALPVASAQIKSALLLAGLYARGETCVVEPGISRDHTERMLRQFGWPVEQAEGRVSIESGAVLQATAVDVPGDFSSAAFMVLAALLAKEGELVIDGVGLNPTRTGLLRILELMGADIDVSCCSDGPGEPVGRLRVRPSRLQGVVIPPELVALAIDEFPLVFVAAALADGDSIVSGAAELRHKESDRIAVMAEGLVSLGIDVEERADGARISGGRLRGGEVDSHGDHRVAMAFATAAVGADGPIRVLNTENVATSFPGFAAQAGKIGMSVQLAGAGGEA